MGMTLDVLKTFVHLTINFPAEKRGFVSSTSTLGCATAGLLQCRGTSTVARNGDGVSIVGGLRKICYGNNGFEIFAVLS